MRIGIDLDGTCVGFIERSMEILQDTYPDHEEIQAVTRPEDIPSGHHFWQEWELSNSQFWKAIRRGDVFASAPVILGATESLNRLDEQGHEIFIVTARSERQDGEATERWLHQHRVPNQSLTFSSDKAVIPVDVFIDDIVTNLHDIDAAGITPVCMAQPWNVDSPYRRARDWEEFEEIIEEIADQPDELLVPEQSLRLGSPTEPLRHFANTPGGVGGQFAKQHHGKPTQRLN